MSATTPATTNATTPGGGHGHHHHGHHHHDGHAHGHGHGLDDLAAANKHHYDNTAHAYEAMGAVIEARAKRVGLAMREIMPLSKDSSSVLEFACGPGIVIKEILPYVKDIVGIDISTVAIERCNKLLKDEGASENSFAIEANIMTEKDVLSGRKFDLVYCASAYHHFDSPSEITKLLSTFLKPDGTLIVIDNLAKGDPKEAVTEEFKAYVARFGFNEEDMKELFAGAGLEFVSFAQVPPDEEDFDIFIAKAVLKSP